MSDQVCFDTKFPAICRALCDLAKEHGWEGSMLGDPIVDPDEYPFFIFDTDGTIHGSRTNRAGDPTITLEETVERIRRGPERQIEWGNLNGEAVIIRRHTIEVNGRVITWADVQSIYKAMAELRGESEQD
jgi:hypothetical protein